MYALAQQDAKVAIFGFVFALAGMYLLVIFAKGLGPRKHRVPSLCGSAAPASHVLPGPDHGTGRVHDHFLVELLHLDEAAFGSRTALQALISSIGYKTDAPIVTLTKR
jgi:hypothetical protein